MNESVDFNDYHVEHGLEQTKAAIVDPAKEFYDEQEGLEDAESEDANKLLNPPPKMHPDGFHGVLNDVCKIATRHSEASAVAIAANTISTFSASIDRIAFQSIGDSVCHARPFFLLVGKTGKARKGTSEYTPYRIFKEVERLLGEDYPELQRHSGGLSTGEGLGYAIRDDVVDEDGVVIEAGIPDKRLYITEAEFGGTLAAASRDKNNLSATIRKVFDGKEISPLVKNSKWCASCPHIVIVGHITAAEFIAKMTEVDIHSGFINRFVILHIVRPKLVPLPKRTPQEDINRVAYRLAEAIESARGEDGRADNDSLEVTLSPEATKYWCGKYAELTKEEPGELIGGLLVRTEMYCRMLAMIFALLDCKNVIEVQHIKAALAWINYWKDSVKYIFGTLAAKASATKLDADAKLVYGFIKDHPGCTRTDLTMSFKHKFVSADITRALNHLMNAAPPLIKQENRPRPGKKPGKGTIVFWKA